MKRNMLEKLAGRLALGLSVLAIAAMPSFAQTTYNLCATTGSVTMPDTTVVPIWGYVAGVCTGAPAELPGPELRATAGETLIINLYTDLTVPVSFFAPGLRPSATAGAAGMLTAEAAAASPASYTFANIKAGTYLYHSGTDITTQVPMGLYGALVVDEAAGTDAYSDVAYDQDEVLLYSEVDPNLNAAPATFGGARVINWNPQYFLINGAAHPETPDITINTSEYVLLRFVNAGLRTFMPTLDGGLYMDLKAEDGNRYPQPLQQYGIELQAGKTIDAMINAGADGSYALYDRGASYDGGVTSIIAGAVAGAPTAGDDLYATDEDVILNVAAPGVLNNDSDPDLDPLSAVLVGLPSAGSLALNADGSFSYTPNADFNGDDAFTYKASDGTNLSNLATVTISVAPVNDAPAAVADYYDEEEGAVLNVEAPGVLANDVDIDGDALTAGNASAPTVLTDADGSAAGNAGSVTLSPDGSFTHDPTGTGLNAGDQVTFTYEACDPALLCSTAAVTITVVPPAANIPPFANDDFAQTTKNSAGITFSVTDNDVDPDGTINVTTVVITTGANTQRGGTVVENGDGTVTYVPKRGFRGTDTFQYQVNDNLGATSNVATVRINVV